MKILSSMTRDYSILDPKPGIMDITPYVPGKSVAAEVAKVLKLSSNENPLGPSPKAVEAYTKHTAKLHRYPDGGCTDLRKAIADVYALNPNRIICGAGSDELIGLLIHAYAGLGDEVLISEHGFLMYKIYALSNSATVVTAPERNLTTDVSALLARVTPATKLVFVANPNNPTGSYLAATEIKRLRDKLPPHVILVIDAAYAEYADRPDYTAGAELVEETPNTVMLRTFSKIYGLSSLRLGWGYFPEHIADVMQRVRGPFNVSGVAQAAGIAAVKDVDYIQKVKDHNTKWLKTLVKEISALSLTVYPSIANFLLVGFPDNIKTAPSANEFLLKRGIIVRDVNAYGLPACLRISIGTEEENKALLDALSIFMKN
jgi:histidinol-phosphate aminotransferase